MYNRDHHNGKQLPSQLKKKNNLLFWCKASNSSGCCTFGIFTVQKVRPRSSGQPPSPLQRMVAVQESGHLSAQNQSPVIGIFAPENHTGLARSDLHKVGVSPCLILLPFLAVSRWSSSTTVWRLPPQSCSLSIFHGLYSSTDFLYSQLWLSACLPDWHRELNRRPRRQIDNTPTLYPFRTNPCWLFINVWWIWFYIPFSLPGLSLYHNLPSYLCTCV